MMDELSTFERRLVGSLDALVGPPRPVDGAALARASARYAGRRPQRWTASVASTLATTRHGLRTRPVLALVVAVAIVGTVVVGVAGVASLVTRPNPPAPVQPIVSPSAVPSRSPTPSASAVPSASPTLASPPVSAAGGLPYVVYEETLGQTLEPTYVGIARSDGSDVHLLSEGITDVAWSPDGSRLLVVRFLGTTGQVERLYLASAADGFVSLHDTGFDTGADHACPLPHRANDVCQDDWFSISPDGRHVAFERACTDVLPGCYSIATIDLATGRVQVLTSTRGDVHQPIQDVTWSPDGRQIVFAREVSAATSSDWTMFIVDATGGNLHRIAVGKLSATEPAWSPDGATIAFASETWGGGRETDVYAVSPDGTGLQRLTTDGVSSQPEWTHDGRIRFYDGHRFMVMDPNGTHAEPAFDFGLLATFRDPFSKGSGPRRIGSTGWPSSGMAVQPQP
jgi:hypothetical protein